MTITSRTTIIALVLICAGLAASYAHIAFGSAATLAAPQCTVSTSTAAIVGNQVSATVLAGNSRRAWATIQRPSMATSSTYLSFDAGNAAVVGKGYGLNVGQTNGATSTPEIAFGLDTDFPYTGAVTGITNYGSTTVTVTQCVY